MMQDIEVFDLSNAISTYLKKLSTDGIELSGIIEHLESDIETDPSAYEYIQPTDFATFGKQDAINYILNVFDNAISLGMPPTNPKYGNADYVKSLVDEVIRNFTGVKTEGLSGKYEFIADPKTTATERGITTRLNDSNLENIIRESSNIVKNIREEFPAEPTSELRTSSYFKALNDADVIDNLTYKQLKDYFNMKISPTPELVKVASWYLNRFTDLENELITGSPTYDESGKTNFATKAFNAIDNEYQNGNRDLDIYGTNADIKYRTPREILQLEQNQIDNLNQMVSANVIDFDNNLSGVLSAIKKVLDTKGFDTADYEPGLKESMDKRIKEVARRVLNDVREINDTNDRTSIINQQADAIINESGNYVQQYENNEFVENLTGFKEGKKYISDLLNANGINPSTISDEDLTILAQDAKNLLDTAMADTEGTNTVPDFRKMIIDNVIKKLPTMQKQKTNFDILSDNETFKTSIGQSLLEALGYSDSASSEVKRYLSEIVAPGFESLIRDKLSKNPSADIDSIIFSGINDLKTGMDARLTDAGLTAADIDPLSLSKRLADDDTLLAMGVDPVTREVSTTMSPKPTQKANIDPLGFQSAIAGIASDDMGFMNFLLSNQQQIQSDFLKAKETQKQPDQDEFAALGNAALKASLGLKPEEDIPSYPGGTPPSTFVGEGGNIGQFPEMNFPILGQKKEPEGLGQKQREAAQFALGALEKPDLKVSDYLKQQSDTLRSLYQKSPEFIQSKFRRPSAFSGITYTQGRT